MATRTQKAATKKKAEAKAAKAKPKAARAAKPKRAPADLDPAAAQRAAAKLRHAAALEARLQGTGDEGKSAKRRKAAKGTSVAFPASQDRDAGGPVAFPAPAKTEEAEASVEVTLSEAEEPQGNGHTGTMRTELDAEPAAAAAPRTEVDDQADNVAEELRRRRSKPITIDADDTPVPTLPVGRKAQAEPKQVLQLDPAPPAQVGDIAAPRGLSIPEHFLLLAVEGTWDERREKARPGGVGGALAGALALELLLQGKLRVQRDRFQVTDVPVDDAAHPVAARLAELGDVPSLQAMGALAKDLRKLLPAYKDRMAARGLVEHRAWRHLGMFYRSQLALVDTDAQERLRNKLARAIAGGGRPDAPTILSLGLLEASGLFGVVVPEGAQAYNRKRLNGLLAGKDVMGYKVDDELKGMQEVAVRTILDNVRLMTVRG